MRSKQVNTSNFKPIYKRELGTRLIGVPLETHIQQDQAPVRTMTKQSTMVNHAIVAKVHGRHSLTV